MLIFFRNGSRLTSADRATATPNRPSRSAIGSTVKSISDAQNAAINTNDTNLVNRENILFIYFDPHSELLPCMITSLEEINNRVQTFNDPSICYDSLQTLFDRIFFLCPADEKDLFEAVHDLDTVEAIFLFGSNPQIDRTQLAKISGIYSQFEELLCGLREALEWFEHTQMDFFSFDRDRMFLWTQLWKEEVNIRF